MAAFGARIWLATSLLTVEGDEPVVADRVSALRSLPQFNLPIAFSETLSFSSAYVTAIIPGFSTTLVQLSCCSLKFL